MNDEILLEKERKNTEIDTMNNSWSDEIALIAILFPIIVTFIAAFVKADYSIDSAWTSLKQAPEWYYGILSLMIAILYGLRSVVVKIVDWWIVSKSTPPPSESTLTVEEIKELYKTFKETKDV